MDLIDFTPDGFRDGAIAEHYDTIARDIRGEYARFIGTLGSKMTYPLDWWLEAPASRNSVFSDLYHEVVCLLTLEQLLASGSRPTRIKVAHTAFGATVKQLAARFDHSIQIELPTSINQCARRLRQTLSPWRSMARLTLDWLIVRMSGVLRPSAALSDNLILVDTFAIPNHVVNDRYYPGLFDFAGSTADHIRLVPQFFGLTPTTLWRAARVLREHPTRYLLKEDWLRIPDMWWTAGHLFRLPTCIQSASEFHGHNLNTLIIADLKKRRGTRCAMRGLLNYRFAAALKRNQQRVAHVVDWFENHPMDRGWNAGFNRWHPNASRIGYVGFYPAGQSYRPTNGEQRAGILPPAFRTIGTGFDADLSEFLDEANIQTAPAFRYPRIEAAPPQKPPGKTIRLLVALPYYPRMCDQVMAIVVALQSAELPLQVALKPHPATLLDSIPDAMVALSQGAEVVTGSLSGALHSADFMLTGAQASTVLEAAALAIPTIMVAVKGEVTEVSVPSALPKSLYGICHEAEAAYTLITRFLLPEQTAIRQADAKTFVARCFTPVNAETVASLLAA